MCQIKHKKFGSTFDMTTSDFIFKLHSKLDKTQKSTVTLSSEWGRQLLYRQCYDQTISFQACQIKI